MTTGTTRAKDDEGDDEGDDRGDDGDDDEGDDGDDVGDDGEDDEGDDGEASGATPTRGNSGSASGSDSGSYTPSGAISRIEVSSSGIEIRYANGAREEIQNGRYRVRDENGNRVVQRRATGCGCCPAASVVRARVNSKCRRAASSRLCNCICPLSKQRNHRNVPKRLDRNPTKQHLYVKRPLWPDSRDASGNP